jgi:hypothetical protein
MCCSAKVSPIVKETAEAILELGQFKLVLDANPLAPPVWKREVRDDEGYKVTVTARIDGDTLTLDLNPRITMMTHHRRVSGGVYLEIATRVAEKCGSKIVQSQNVGECIENGDRTQLLADYGNGQPLDWSAVCLGYQRVIMGEAV